MLKKITLFSIRLFISIAVVFFVHVELLKYYQLPPYNNLIIEGYYANVILAIFIYSSLSLLQKKYNDQLGFLFMVGSLLKFAVFFIFFSPNFRQNGDISRLEFLSFFVPYLICLLLETVAIVKILNPSKKEE